MPIGEFNARVINIDGSGEVLVGNPIDCQYTPDAIRVWFLVNYQIVPRGG